MQRRLGLGSEMGLMRFRTVSPVVSPAVRPSEVQLYECTIPILPSKEGEYRTYTRTQTLIRSRTQRTEHRVSYTPNPYCD